MKEHDFFKKVIYDHAINDAYIKARTKYATPRGFAWRKAVSIAAAAFVVLVGTVFMIPSARAEVLSWFGITTPQDYLAADPADRTEIPEIEALITSPETTDGFKLIPIDRTDSKAVNSEGALKLSEFFYENSDIQMGDAMFDGKEVYQTIRLNGLSGLYLLEMWTGGHQAGVKVDPYAVWGLYENGPDIEYLTGKKAMYERPDGHIIYEMPDGKQFQGMLDLSGAIDPYYNSLCEQGLMAGDRTEEIQKKIDEQNRAYLQENGLTAVASIYGLDGLTDYADGNGNLTAKVYYKVFVCEEDRGDGNFVPATELFYAQLGTITVNMKAYQDLQASQFENVASAVWGPETVTLSRVDVDFGRPDDRYADDRIAFSKQRASTEGLMMGVEDIHMDALGIHDIQIRVLVPEAWTKEQREALAESLEFKTLINGEAGNWYLNSLTCTVQEDGSVLFHARSLDEVPYDMLKSVREISFIPMLRWFESVDPHDTNDKPLGTLTPDYGEVVWSRPGVNGWDADDAVAEFPQYALVLKVK
ncbi:MAG: hypothetical protein IKE11_06570 [Clostridia bacterium]|nr:hypothetical protein [Clostridia bacterium]